MKYLKRTESLGLEIQKPGMKERIGEKVRVRLGIYGAKPGGLGGYSRMGCGAWNAGDGATL